MTTALKQTEAAFSQKVVDFAQLMGWKVYRTWNSIHSPKGFPDLVMVKDGKMIIAELKTESGQITAAQAEWLAELEKVDGVQVFLWRPPHFESEITTVLGEGKAR